MNRYITMAGFVVLFSVPAHAQSRSAGSSGAGVPTNSYSGSGGGGGLSAGNSGGSIPPYPRARFEMNAISGTDDAFTPSSFLPYKQAVALGEAALAANRKSVAEEAEENHKAEKAKTQLVFVQDPDGNVVPLRR